MLKADGGVLPLLVIGEDDLAIQDGWVDARGDGVLSEVGTGTGGQTLNDLADGLMADVLGVSVEKVRGAEGFDVEREAFLAGVHKDAPKIADRSSSLCSKRT